MLRPLNGTVIYCLLSFDSKNTYQKLIKIIFIDTINIIYNITRLNRIYGMNRKISQVWNFSFLYTLHIFAFFKLKLSLNWSETAGPLKFSLTVLFLYYTVQLYTMILFQKSGWFNFNWLYHGCTACLVDKELKLWENRLKIILCNLKSKNMIVMMQNNSSQLHYS